MFKEENNIKSGNDTTERYINKLDDVLTTGKDRSTSDGYYIRKYRSKPDEKLPYFIFDHGCYFKTKDNQIIYIAHSYSKINEINEYLNTEWQQKNSLLVNILDKKYSWYSSDCYLIVIMYDKKLPPVMEKKIIMVAFLSLDYVI